MRTKLMLNVVLAALIAAAAEPPRLPVSHRELPTAWGATEIATPLTVGPDGSIYFATAGPRASAKFGRFVPATQRFELLADLGKLTQVGEEPPRPNARGPVVFDRAGQAWLGTSAYLFSRDTPVPGVAGRLLCYAPDGKPVGAPLELPGWSITGLALVGDHLLMQATGTETHLVRYSLPDRKWRYGGMISPQPGALAALPDGRAVVIATDNRVDWMDAPDFLRCLGPMALAKAPDDKSGTLGGAAALVASPDGARFYGLARGTGELFEITLTKGHEKDTLRYLGPAFGDAAVPGQVPVGESRLAFCLGPGPRLVYAGGSSNCGLVAACDLQTGQRSLLGAMAVPARVLVPPLTGAACVTADGRVWMSGFGQPGCGLYVFPPLPEAAGPWSNADRVYDCPQVADDAIKFDGDLGDPAWQPATPLEGFLTAGPQPAPVRCHTTARLAWSPTRLFFSATCDINALRAPPFKRDENVWDSECAELFVCPQGADAPYFEVDINPNQVLYDTKLYGYTYTEQAANYQAWAKAWNPAVTSAVAIRRDAQGAVTGWTVEFAVPLADLEVTDLHPGTVWLFNVFRVAHWGEKQLEYQCWQPTYTEFHRPHQFPKLRFTGRP